MKVVAVADAFVHEEYYRKAEKLFPEFEFEKIIFFGLPDRKDMRGIAYQIERGGPMAYPAPEELYENIADAEGLMVHLCPVTRRLIESAPKLKIIMANRGGLENIDLQAASEHGIAVLHNPAHNANGVTELTIGLMIAESRNISRADAVMKQGKWREYFPNSGKIWELRNQTVGLIGFGNIGKRVARLLAAFNCHTMFYDPNVPADDPDAIATNCRKTTLEEVMSASDYVTLHARTNELIVKREHFAMMKPTAYFINTARPHLIDNTALYETLRDHKILGAALDVHSVEPTDPNDPMTTLDNVTLVNHRGGDTLNSYADSPEMVLEEAQKLLHGNKNVKFWANEKETAKNY